MDALRSLLGDLDATPQLASVSGWIAVIGYGLAITYGLARQIAAWTNGWLAYGRLSNAHIVRYSNDQPGRTPESAIACKKHNPYRHEANYPLTNGWEPTNVATMPAPAKQGTRNWTYAFTLDGPRYWHTWVWQCFKLAATRRYIEPDIPTCPICKLL